MAEGFLNGQKNTVGKGEIAHYEQFLLFPLCFSKICTANTQKAGLVWERVNVWSGLQYLSFNKSISSEVNMFLVITELIHRLEKKFGHED